jgi:hypothetical protein
MALSGAGRSCSSGNKIDGGQTKSSRRGSRSSTEGQDAGSARTEGRKPECESTDTNTSDWSAAAWIAGVERRLASVAPSHNYPVPVNKRRARPACMCVRNGGGGDLRAGCQSTAEAGARTARSPSRMSLRARCSRPIRPA